ncbi:DNA cytosine methyltransferase [Iodobacter fluviatilis]|uniref:Cytosine-specific methyltransferase n=1 Tax=Iodobacter fluviatilis TaxID=537 RepID=A0A7G3GBS3_9NEIS|nr:DNA cytosine methyltransferase [Iodobacter fluviatilis]QBC44588.1 DNA (cytosine-5-)-methyltransferase [Iodobacter fluviatilis]
MKIVDLFCGVGGLSLGFQSAGFDIKASYDSWEKAVAIYRDNFSHPVYKFDLSDSDKASESIGLLNPNIIIGGPPCQDFSHAGKRSEGTRANLTSSFATIVSTVRPEWFVMENVDRAQNSSAYKEARDILKLAGYGLSENVLNASLCGVPQKRKRFFCIGKLGEIDGFMDDFLMSGLSEKAMTMRDYFGSELGLDHYYRHPRNYSRRGIFSMDEPAPTIRGVNRPVPPNYVKHDGDTSSLDGIRPLTTLERARVQTFPSDFSWSGTKTDLEQMIGNAVPVELGKYVANAIKKYIDKNGK